MKILITGAAGFIGFHLCKKLLSLGYNVTGIDNLNNYYDKNLKKLRLDNLHSKNFKFHNLDINSINKVNAEYNLVINLAAQAGVRVKKNEIANYKHSNRNGFEKVCQYCLKNSITKLIYASSSAVYDDSSKKAFSEDKTPLKPKSIYGESKLFNERFAQQFNDELSTIGLRFFSVYGPFGRPDMAYFSFTNSIKNGQEIHLFNRGMMARDMTYIDDAIDGILKSIDFIIDKDHENKNEIFNIGKGSPILTSKILETIEEKLNKKAFIRNIEVFNESSYTHADLEKSKEVLRYNPKTSFDDGIIEFLEWHKYYEK